MEFLKDIKVVELASVLAGPNVGMFLAELGASVVKIENASTGGDVTRNWKLPQEDESLPYSAYYCCTNWGKQTLFKNLRSKDDNEEVRRLINEADIVITNFKNSFAKETGMDYETLSKDNPRLIYASLSSGLTPEDTPAFDVVLQAEAGILYINGNPKEPPVKMPVPMIDLLAAHQLKEGILLALLERQKTGLGAKVSSSLLEAALASLVNQATNYLMVNHIPQPMGSKHPNIAPYGDTFVCKDGKSIVLAAGTEKQFRVLCEALDLNELPTTEKFATNTHRLAHREELAAMLADKIKLVDRNILLEKLLHKGVPAGSIRNMEEVFELQKARDMILEEKMPDGKVSKRLKSVAFQFHKTMH